MESEMMEEIKQLMRKQLEDETRVATLRENVIANLEARFGVVPTDISTQVNAIADDKRLRALLRSAATCASIDAFAVILNTQN